jgi:hypothetical protein
MAKICKESWQFYGYPLLFQKDGNKIHSLKGEHSLSELNNDLGIQTMKNWTLSSLDFKPIEQHLCSLKQELARRGLWLRLED